MSRALPAILAAALLLCGPAQAQTRRRSPAAAKTAAFDAAAFDQTHEMIFLLAGQAYLKDQIMPDPASLDPIVAALKDPALGKAREKKLALERLISGAECIQGGPAGMTLDIYRLAVVQAAEDLKVGAIVEQDFIPNARAGRSLNEEEKALVKACQGEARDQAYDRRGFYQKCLGRRRSEAVYLAPARLARSPAGIGLMPQCEPVLGSVAQSRRKLAPGLSDEVGRKLLELNRQFAARPPVDDGLPAQVQPGRDPRPGTAPGQDKSSPPGTGAADLKLTEPPLDTADLDAGLKLARVSKAGEIGFTGYCYSYVKAALQKAGIVDRADIDKAGAAGHAKLFADFVEKNPALLKRKLRRIPEPSWPVPIGTIVIWSAGACGYSATSGHIEIVTRIKPPQACSDGCGTFQTACLDELSADPARARTELPKVQEEFAAAQLAYDAAKTKANQAALRRRQAALKTVERRLEPRVAAYVVERQ